MFKRLLSVFLCLVIISLTAVTAFAAPISTGWKTFPDGSIGFEGIDDSALTVSQRAEFRELINSNNYGVLGNPNSSRGVYYFSSANRLQVADFYTSSIYCSASNVFIITAEKYGAPVLSYASSTPLNFIAYFIAYSPDYTPQSGSKVVPKNHALYYDIGLTPKFTFHSDTKIFTLTVKYQYEDKTEAFPTVTKSLESGTPYNISSPTKTGYTPSLASVTGTMGSSDNTVTVTYTKDYVPPTLYTLTVKYQYEDKTEAFPNVTKSLESGTPYDIASPVKAGYTPSLASVTGTMGSADTTVTVTYTKDYVPPILYTLTVRYLYEGGEEAFPSVTKSLESGTSYGILSPTKTGYTASLASVTGIMGEADKTVTVTYKLDRPLYSPSDFSGFMNYFVQTVGILVTCGCVLFCGLLSIKFLTKFISTILKY